MATPGVNLGENGSVIPTETFTTNDQAHAGRRIDGAKREARQAPGGGEDVKPKCLLVAVVTCLAMTSATPALTASREIQPYAPTLRFGIEKTPQRSWPTA